MDTKEDKLDSDEDAVRKISESVLRTAREAYENIRIEKEKLEQELQEVNADREKLQLLLTDFKLQKDREIEEQCRGSRAEIASLQNILQASQSAALHSGKIHEQDIHFLKEENSGLRKKITGILQSSRRNSNGLQKDITSVVNHGVGNVIPGSIQANEYAESSMGKAQENALILRSLIIPLDEEMEQLKKSLHHTMKQLQLYRETFSGLLNEIDSSGLNDVMKDMLYTTEIKSVRKKFQNKALTEILEHAVRNDLEKYIAVLYTDRTVLQEEVQYLTDQLKTAQKELSDSVATFAIAIPLTSSSENQIQSEDFYVPVTQNELQVEEQDEGVFCAICSKYKRKLLEVEQETQWQINQYEETLQLHKLCLQEEQNFRSQLEIKFTEMANNYRSQLTALMEMVTKSEGMIVGLRDDYSKWCQEIQIQLAQIFSEKQEMQNQMMKLKSENCFLLAKFMQKASELQLETYRLPTDIEQMKILYRKMYEDLTIALVALDQQETMMKSEIDWLTNCIMVERETKEQLSENLKTKLVVCQESCALAQNLKVELNTEKKKKTEVEEKLKATEAELQKVKTENKCWLATLERRMDKLGQARVKLEDQVFTIKDQIMLQMQQNAAKSEIKTSKEKKDSKATNAAEKLPENMDIDEATIKVCCASCQLLLVLSQERHFCHQCLKILCKNCIHTTTVISPGHSSAAFGKELCKVCISMIQGQGP